MKPANSFDELYQQIRLRRVPFLIAFFVIVTISYGILYAVDFIPEPVEEAATQEKDTVVDKASLVETVESKESVPEPAVVTSPLPIKLFIDKLDKEIVILNPTSPTIAAIDEALLEGAVRHPDSADFEKTGNIFLLGHSSYLPNVFNKNFQAFNGIQKLTWGDTIRLQSEDTEYVYRVQEVTEEKATNAVVPYTWGEAKLTLVTCNSFGATEDRFIVVATLIETVAL